MYQKVQISTDHIKGNNTGHLGLNDADIKVNQHVGKTTLEGVSNPKLDEIKTLIKNGEVKGKNIISQIDENTQIVFRNDTGVNAHPVKPKGYIDPVDHYNVEIQTKTPAGKWKSKWSYHIVFDENGNIIDTFD